MIQLNQIKPAPLLPDGIDPKTQTWGKKIAFEKGKFYLITAPSGKGKSTFVHILYGLRTDFEGAFKLKGQEHQAIKMNDWSDIRKNTLSVIFQDLRLFLNLSAMDNLLLQNNLTKHKTVEEIKQMAKQLGISDLLEKTCSTLSYGQRQRVAIIRALCQPFEFLLLDEPFSHLDQNNIAKATQLIKEECQGQKAGLILVSLGDKYLFDYDKELIL